MHPAPEGTVAVPAVVALDAEAEWITREAFAVQDYFARENGVRVRGFGKADPTLVAEDDFEVGVVVEIPGDGVAVDVKIAFAGILVDDVFSDAEMER